MPYVMETVKCGKIIEIRKYYSSRYGKPGRGRAQRMQETPEDMKLINEQNAERKLRQLLNANFKENDLHIVLTYRKGFRPSPSAARLNLDKFMRKLRASCAAADEELRYIAVTEYKKAAIHHHLVIQNMDIRRITALWEFGRVLFTPLDGSGQYKALAEYLIKETRETFRSANPPSKKRWNASKNLIKPKVEKKVIPRESWRLMPKDIKGYIVDRDSVQNYACKRTGFPAQSYYLRRIEQEGKDEKRSRFISAVRHGA